PLLSLTHPYPTQLHTLSLHDALPISSPRETPSAAPARPLEEKDLPPHQTALSAAPDAAVSTPSATAPPRTHTTLPPPAFSTIRRDRKSTRLNSSHRTISYAVFCLKKK